MAKANHKLMERDLNCGKQFNASTGVLWRWKRDRKKQRGSTTPGANKGENCHASNLDRFMSKRNRSYKHKEYAGWVARVRKQNNSS